MKPLRHHTNEITSGILHLVGAVAGVTILVLLIIFSSLHGTAWHIVGFTVYGVFLSLLYLASTLYHLMPQRKTRVKEILQRIDHAAVYFLIAGTYTPVCFLVLEGALRWFVFGVLWTLAIVGATLKLTKVKTAQVVPVLLYLIMGWFIIFFFEALRENMSTTALALLISGGISYTAGVIFFVLESKVRQIKYFSMHELFHVFVLGGSTLHTIMMFLLL